MNEWKKGWLCFQAVGVELKNPTTGAFQPATLPEDVLGVLPIYRTKKAAQKAHGKNAPLMKVTPIEGGIYADSN